MNTCGTCKFFGKPVHQLERFDDDNLEPVESKLHACELVKHLKERAEQEQAGAAVVIDGSDYLAVLCVREEFGCNQWQQRGSALVDKGSPPIDGDHKPS